MKKLLLIAAALSLALTACTSTPTTPAQPMESPTPEPTAAATPATTLMFIPARWNTGDALYELRWNGAANGTDSGILLQTDYDTLTQALYCTVPGCAHDSDACPAYLSEWSCMGVMAVDGTVYAYPTELHADSSNKTIYRVDPAGGRTAVAAAPRRTARGDNVFMVR